MDSFSPVERKNEKHH